jgi:hypothetical protein
MQVICGSLLYGIVLPTRPYPLQMRLEEACPDAFGGPFSGKLYELWARYSAVVSAI